MFSAARNAPLTRSGPRIPPIVVSLLAHAGVLSLVVFGPAPKGSGRRSLYDQVIKAREHDLVWYSFRQKLPEVSPLEKQDPKPPAAELRSPGQTVISNPKQGERGTQMIWRPVPQVKPQPEIASPNIMAFRLPLIAPPPPAPPRKLLNLPARTPPKKSDSAPALPEPPKVQAKIDTMLASLRAAVDSRPAPRDFVPPVPKPQRRVAVTSLPEAPRLATALRSERVPMLAENMAAPLANKPQARTFTPPPAPGRPAATPVALPDAPKIATQLARQSGAGRNPAIQDVSAEALANKPKAREFVPPPMASGSGNGVNRNATMPVVEEAPSLDVAGLPSANVNVAVVGLNPAAKLKGPLPETSREARFSVGPNAGAGDGGASSGSSSALSVPGLLVRGNDSPGPSPANPLLVARAAPTSREALEAAAKAASAASAAMPANPPAAEIHLAPPPDPQFNGRDVYTLAVQMPNITSYVGSWIMWFAERSPGASGGLRPPVPIHKVDPKYYQSTIAERVEGKVQIAAVIRTDGRVELARIVKSVDARLDRSAKEALLKWQFAPAERNGKPVEVDLVAEIPFLLAPQARP